MLPKTRRLDRLSFLKVLNAPGKIIKSPDFQIRYTNNELSFNRFSVVVTKKVAKLAVKRNALKRKIYDLVAKIPGSHDIIIYPKNENHTPELHSLVSKIS